MSGVAHIVARSFGDDSHTLAVLALADAMQDGGQPAVFSADAQHRVDGVKSLHQLAAADASLLVYHERGAAPALVGRLAELATHVAVAHSDVPPDALALRDLQVLAAAGAVGIATSEGGAARLAGVGFARVARVPPVVARERLAAVDAFVPTTHHLDVALHGPLVVCVNDVADAISSARVVQAYHVLRTYLVRAGHLAIAVPEGPNTSEAAVRAVHREIWGLRLPDAWLQRLTNSGERSAFMRRAAVFVTTDTAAGDTGHALAAMAEGVPVVAPADASAREVLGDGALVLPADAGAALVAEAIADLLSDESRRARFAAAASRVVAQYDPGRVAPAWRAALAA